MFDITQVKSGLEKKNLKEDVQYIGDLLQKTIYIDKTDNETTNIEVPDYAKQINNLLELTHVHSNASVLDRITADMINSLDKATSTFELENYEDFATKEYVNNEISKVISTDIILTSPDGTEFLLTINKDGTLVPIKQI